MGMFDSARRGPRRAAWFASRVAPAVLAAFVGCFRPDYLDYTACTTSEPCAEAGLAACVLVPDEPERRGFCADSCALDTDCPGGQDGSAAPRCLLIDDVKLCALDCLGDRPCPTGYVCREVRDGESIVRDLCFPQEEAS